MACKLVAARIQLAIRAVPISTSQGPLPVSLSIGVASKKPGAKLSSVIHQADQSLYEAKRKGRDCVVQWSEDLVDIISKEVA